MKRVYLCRQQMISYMHSLGHSLLLVVYDFSLALTAVYLSCPENMTCVTEIL